MRDRDAVRGSALLTVVALSSILLVLVLGLLLYASNVRRRSINSARGLAEQSCTAAGLQLARAYFGSNYVRWNEFLANPGEYNPIGWTAPANPSPPVKSLPKAPPHATEEEINRVKELRTNRKELFADLDGDGNPDVYIYCRDNLDERPPAKKNDWTRDSDQAIIIGAMCISDTLAPRRQDGTVDPDALTAESLLKWEYRPGGSGDLASGGNTPGRNTVTGGAGGSGSGNRNN